MIVLFVVCVRVSVVFVNDCAMLYGVLLLGVVFVFVVYVYVCFVCD